MKKIKFFMMMIMSMVTLVSLTSCEDENIAYDLEGTWRGDMYMVRDGYRAVYTEIEFIGDPFRMTSGTGYWRDVYSHLPNDYFASRIDWKVRDRRIYIWLLDDRDRYGNPFEMVISDYRLAGNRFSGYVDYEGGSREFNLYRTSSPHWTDYYYGYSDNYIYGCSDNYYYPAKGVNGQKKEVTHTHEMRQD